VKVLLDENLDPRLRLALVGHDATTAVYAGWAGLRNGELLNAAEAAGYEVFLTGDRNLPAQQNREKRAIAIVVLTAHQWTIIQQHLSKISEAIGSAKPGTLQVVDCGEFRR
jgi:hypothetical protein